MITCNRCGNMSPAGAVNCQTCGAPLSSKIETGLSPARSSQEQELPAWLESLRAGERPAAPANNDPANFSPADLIEEGSLPSWMRSRRPGMNDVAASGPDIVLRPSATAGPNTDDAQGINAKSLVDERSLPAWMQENRQPTGPTPQGGIAASSLLQQDLMPDWMKSLQQQSPGSNPVMPAVQPPPLPPRFPEPPGLSPVAESASDFSLQPGQGFSTRGLVDQQSLPQWMAQEEGKNPTPAQSAPGGGISPSSLLDPDSLPSWLRESAKGEGFPPVQTNQSWQPAQPSAGGQAMPPLMQPGSPVWQPAPPPISPAMNNASAQGGNMAASSFIDPNALPDWLRSGMEQQQPGGAIPPQGPVFSPGTGYGVPPRVENVRVPSRPRGEISSNENNEAAANVFASMLGVASAAPNFPGSPPVQNYGMQGGAPGQGGSMYPMQGPGSNMPGQQMAGTPPGMGMQGSQQAQSNIPGGFNSGMYQTGNQGQGNYALGNSFASQYPAGSPGATPNAMGGMGMETDNGQTTPKKPAKKGIFDVIRDWFH